MSASEVFNSQLAQSALLESWSSDTGILFGHSAHPSYGQCAQTAIVIQDIFGGDILKLLWNWEGENKPQKNHFYNMVDGEIYDFTIDQFDVEGIKVAFHKKDIPSSIEEAMEETNVSQVAMLKAAFQKNYLHKNSVIVN